MFTFAGNQYIYIMNTKEFNKVLQLEIEQAKIKSDLFRKKEIDNINSNKKDIAELNALIAELHEHYSYRLRYLSLALTLLK